MAETTTVPRSLARTPSERSGAVIEVLHAQLSGMAGAIPEPKLAGPLQHFAGAALWARCNLDCETRRESLASRLDGLRTRAAEVLGTNEDHGSDLSDLIVVAGRAAERGVDGARALLDDLLLTARDLEEGSVAAADADDADAPPAQVDVEAMTTYLRDRFGDETEAHDVHYITGGFSKHTILVTATIEGERQEIIVRQVPRGRHWEDLPLEYAVLSHVWSPELPLAEPLWLEMDEGKLGGIFTVSRKAAGSNLGDVFGASGAAVPEQFCLDLADFLATLHAIDPTGIEKAPVVPMRTPEEINAAIDEMEGKAAASAGIGPRLEAVFAWLRANVPQDAGSAAIVHGDVGMHNTLQDDGRLSAVLDWERAHFGDPAEDLAYLKPTLSPVFSWDAFMDRYEAAGGTRPDPASERFYTVWQDVWRHVECLVLGEDFFDQRGVPMLIAGFVLGPQFLASAVATAFGPAERASVA